MNGSGLFLGVPEGADSEATASTAFELLEARGQLLPLGAPRQGRLASELGALQSELGRGRGKTEFDMGEDSHVNMAGSAFCVGCPTPFWVGFKGTPNTPNLKGPT